MDQTPLVSDEIDAGAEFIRRLHGYRPVKAAFWLRRAEEGERYLHVALDGLTEHNINDAYVEVLRITQAMKDHYIDPFRVNLVTLDDPVVRAVLDIYRRFPGRVPPRYHGPVLGDVAVAEVYIYPQPAAKP
jgi:hypothetical protein